MTRALSQDEVAGEYERQTGLVIVETFRSAALSPDEVTAVLVANHGPFVWAADPVPAGIGAFRSLERAVTVTSRGFALFERHAGVWLATVLIVALLIWSARP